MALLSDVQRQEAWAAVMRALSARREPIGALNKSDLRAALNAADQWASDNQASYNSALPAAAQAALTSAQKAELLKFVIEKRYVEGV